jgi:glutamate-ammonia-ligase adenylyltransferase
VAERDARDRGLPRDLRSDVDRSASPPIVRLALQRLAESDSHLLERLEADESLRRATLAVTASSRSLTRQLEADTSSIEVLADLATPVAVEGGDIATLARTKQREYLRIAARDLTGRDDLATTMALIADLARNVLAGACGLAHADDLAVIGMGKLGGDELNYASDVDLVFVGDGPPDELERVAREVVELAGQCFRIDTNLRPEGRSGSLVRSLESYEAYWDRWAEPWEFQALLKARPAAGDPTLGAEFYERAQARLWTRPLDADDLRSIRAMKERTENEVVRRGHEALDITQGRGGIRDVAFAVQILQLVHGQNAADLREANTIAALGELAAADYVDPSDATELIDAHRFLRTVEHRLQLADEQQVHVVPSDDDARRHLARVMGYRDTTRGDALAGFDHELLEERLTVRLIHERLYFRPLLEAFAGSPGAVTPEAAVTRLTAFGFTDARRTQAAVRELTHGLNRSSRLMQQLLPLLLDWLSRSPDPDLGLLMLRNLLTGPQRQSQLTEAFRESPEVARRLCEVLGTSRLLGDILVRNPDVIPRLADESRLRTLPHDSLVKRARTAVEWRADVADRQLALQRWQHRHLVGIAARDLFGFDDVATVGVDLTTLASATLELAVESLHPTLPFAVVALGRLSGGELSYASDLDVVFVYDGDPNADVDEAERLSRELLQFVNGPTPAARIYEIDTDLRPEGRQGVLARTVDGYATYFDRWAEDWDRQAFSRATVIAGDAVLGRQLLERLEPSVWGPGVSPDDEREIRRMKARIEAERIPIGEDPEFHLKLGRGSLSDIEWTAQLLQLRHGIRATGTRQALRRLRDADLLDEDETDHLVEAYEFLGQVRNRLYLVQSAAGDSLPTQPETLAWLARSLRSSPTELRDRYRRVTRRARKVFERRFYGR